MDTLIVFVGIMVVLVGLVWGEKWYAKLAYAVVGVVFASLPFVARLIAMSQKSLP